MLVNCKLFPFWTRSKEKFDPCRTHLWLKSWTRKRNILSNGELISGLGKTTKTNNTTQCNAPYKGPRMTNIHSCHLILKSLSKQFPIFKICSLDWKVEMTNQSEPNSKWWARRSWLQPSSCTFMQGDHAWVCGRWVPSCVFARCVCIALIKRHKYR